MAASFPAATPAEVKRLTDPAQLNRLSGALGEAEPLNHRQLPARPEDDLLCIFMEGDSGNGPCLRLWIQENLLQSPAGLYTPPQGFAGLLADLRKNAFVTCDETPAQDRWPEDYGLARGEGEIWLVDSGGAHEAGAQRKVGWRVVRAAGRLVVKARRLDGTDTFEMAITQRVAPNGRDQYPMYWDAVSYLTFPSAGCWELTLQAGERTERITLNVR
ncbi:MAG TPA: hypothetical protein VD902_02400 [Symbiobacteriaceae bacterium]|nr:hypothetical protein [Symbiobacteriaceae bacterium]